LLKIHGVLIGVIKDLLNFGIKVMVKECAEFKCTLHLLKNSNSIPNYLKPHLFARVFKLKPTKMKIAHIGKK